MGLKLIVIPTMLKTIHHNARTTPIPDMI